MRVSSKHITPAAQCDSFKLDTITIPSCQGLLRLLIHGNNRQAVSSPALYRFCWQKQRAVVFWGLTRLEVIGITWSCVKERLQHALPAPIPCKPYLQSHLCAHQVYECDKVYFRTSCIGRHQIWGFGVDSFLL